MRIFTRALMIAIVASSLSSPSISKAQSLEANLKECNRNSNAEQCIAAGQAKEQQAQDMAFNHLLAVGTENFKKPREAIVTLTEAKELYIKACLLENYEGCLEVGRIYGLSKVDDFQLNFQDIQNRHGEACENGNHFHCLMLSFLGDRKAPGIPERIRSKRFQVYTRGCEANNALACGLLSMSYEYGWDVNVDKSRARELNRKACAEGYKRAC